MSSHDDLHGVWKHVYNLSPKPERDEISQLIGRKLLEDNSNLWTEISALKSIVFEMTGNNYSTESLGRRNGKLKLYKSGKKSLAAAMSFSQLHYQDEISNNDCAALDAVYSKQKFNIELLTSSDQNFGTFVDCIRYALREEKVELKSVIEQLNYSLDGNLMNSQQEVNLLQQTADDIYLNRSDNCSSSFSQSRDKDSNPLLTSVSSHSLDKSSSSANRNIIRSSNDCIERSLLTVCNVCGNVINSVDFLKGKVDRPDLQSRHTICAQCSRIKIARKEKAVEYHTVQDSEAKIITESSIGQGKNNNQSPSSTSSTPRGNTSKFRNRLDSARHELHFLDDF